MNKSTKLELGSWGFQLRTVEEGRVTRSPVRERETGLASKGLGVTGMKWNTKQNRS